MIKLNIKHRNFNSVEKMSLELQKNISIFSKVIDNIKKLNSEVDIREQNTKIQANIESLIK